MAEQRKIVTEAVTTLRDSFNSGETRSLKWRLKTLKQMRRMVTEARAELLEALNLDLRKSSFEGYFFEINQLEHEIENHIQHLEEWATPEPVTTDLINTIGIGRSCIKRDPLGVVCIIAAWNYPVLLTLQPLVGVISAGNCCLIKVPSSNYSVNVAKTLAKVCSKYLDTNFIRVVEGDRRITGAILDQRFDFMFFTGGSFVGKMVAEAAAKHFTPVVLEMGGKSPCIVEPSADMYVSALRIAQGKFTNSGQTCICPDYVMVHESVAQTFIDTFKKVLVQFYGKTPQNSPDYCRLINARAFKRVKGLLDASEEYVVHGGKADADDLFVAPTLLDFGTDLAAFGNAPVMNEEIFGSLLPVLRYRDMADVYAFIRAREKPLSMYWFSSDYKSINKARDDLTSGAFVGNDCLFHMSNHELPFGGVGHSGMGKYHGKYTFDCFSHQKAVLVKGTATDVLLRLFRYPAAGRSESMKKFVFWGTYLVQYPRYLIPSFLAKPLKFFLYYLAARWLMQTFPALQSLALYLLTTIVDHVDDLA